MMKLRTRRALALAGSAVALSIALTGCSTISNLISGDAPRDEETGEVTEESNIDIFSLKVGDCMPADAMSNTEQTDADVVPCAEPHGYEVYPGTHTSAVAVRFQNHVLPFFGRHLRATPSSE